MKVSSASNQESDCEKSLACDIASLLSAAKDWANWGQNDHDSQLDQNLYPRSVTVEEICSKVAAKICRMMSVDPTTGLPLGRDTNAAFGCATTSELATPQPVEQNPDITSEEVSTRATYTVRRLSMCPKFLKEDREDRSSKKSLGDQAEENGNKLRVATSVPTPEGTIRRSAVGDRHFRQQPQEVEKGSALGNQHNIRFVLPLDESKMECNQQRNSSVTRDGHLIPSSKATETQKSQRCNRIIITSSNLCATQRSQCRSRRIPPIVTQCNQQPSNRLSSNVIETQNSKIPTAKQLSQPRSVQRFLTGNDMKVPNSLRKTPNPKYREDCRLNKMVPPPKANELPYQNKAARLRQQALEKKKEAERKALLEEERMRNRKTVMSSTFAACRNLSNSVPTLRLLATSGNRATMRLSLPSVAEDAPLNLAAAAFEQIPSPVPLEVDGKGASFAVQRLSFGSCSSYSASQDDAAQLSKNEEKNSEEPKVCRSSVVRCQVTRRSPNHQ